MLHAIRAEKLPNDKLAESIEALWSEMSAGVETHPIRDVSLDVITGKTPSTTRSEYYGSYMPFVTIPDMHNRIWLDYSERCLSETGVKNQPLKTVQRGAVLVSCIATVGLVGIASKQVQFNQQINAVLPKTTGDEFWLHQALCGIKDELLAIGAGGSATLNVSKGALSGIEIPWGSDQERSRFAESVAPLYLSIEAQQKEQQILEESLRCLLEGLARR